MGKPPFRLLKPAHWFGSLKHLLVGVFFPRFDDEELERRFKSQEWHGSKVYRFPVPAVRFLIFEQMLALVSSGFLVLNWILSLAVCPLVCQMLVHVPFIVN
jgi:hypothetical protein